MQGDERINEGVLKWFGQVERIDIEGVFEGPIP